MCANLGGPHISWGAEERLLRHCALQRPALVIVNPLLKCIAGSLQPGTLLVQVEHEGLLQVHIPGRAVKYGAGPPAFLRRCSKRHSRNITGLETNGYGHNASSTLWFQALGYTVCMLKQAKASAACWLDAPWPGHRRSSW